MASHLSTPSDGFNIYDDIKAKLIQRGVPEDEISFIHKAKSDVQKAQLFAKVRKGSVRVLMGSTAKMGAGTNIQSKLIALHHCDIPWRPSDIEQREGRILRQGNNNAKVEIYRYVTESTFDSFMWQTIENKQKFISQVMTGKTPARSCEDIDETVLSYAEIKALAVGDERIKEKMDLELEVSKLQTLKSAYLEQKYHMEDCVFSTYPKKITLLKELLPGLEKDAQYFAEQQKVYGDSFPPMTICGVRYDERKGAGIALLEACKSTGAQDTKEIGEYLGFKMNLQFDKVTKKYIAVLSKNREYSVELGGDAGGNISRIDNELKRITQRVEDCKTRIEDTQKQLEQAKIEMEKPCEHERELAGKQGRLAELNAELDLDGGNPELDVEPDMDEKKES